MIILYKMQLIEMNKPTQLLEKWITQVVFVNCTLAYNIPSTLL